jgi:dipeptidyl-peptidase-3
MRYYISFSMAMLLLISSCKTDSKESNEEAPKENVEQSSNKVDEFADISVLRYKIPDWDKLSLNDKKLVYYLTQAGLSGRDIIWDQNYKHNLAIRNALESIYINYEGDRSSSDWEAFETYTKRVWFANGIHHHYSMDKMKPEFSKEYLNELLTATDTDLSKEATDVLFNDQDAKKVNLDKSKGLLKGSATNFYGDDVTADEVEDFYAAKEQPDPDKPISFGLNSKLVKENGKLVEKKWKLNGMYHNAIQEIIKWLEKAVEVAENEKQAKALKLLIDYYKTGDLQTWDKYNVAWVEATEGEIDYINSFIEVYNDPLGYRGSYETIVEIKDFDMSQKMNVLQDNVQWFEDNSTIADEHKKENVVGVSYKTVNVAGEAGDASPATPIGVNLPNSSWIRKEHGSKSVSLGNIIRAYERSGSSGRLEEFAHDSTEIALHKKYSAKADKLHTALHEVVGHASGQLNKGVGTTKETLKSYASTLEEGRADLVGLYFLMDKKLEDIGLTDNAKKLGMAAYDDYIRNALLTQLVRIDLGKDIEEAHMRNRQWVSAWVYEKGKEDGVIKKVTQDGKTYYDIQDYEKLRALFGELLRETQRIKSEGDYEAARNLVENYGVKVDQELHKEVLKRNEQFKSKPYSGFVNPVLVPVKDNSGKITDIKVEQTQSFVDQMLNYADKYSFLTQ